MTIAAKDENAPRSLALQARTKEFALQVIRLVDALPRSTTAQILGKQLLRAGTSVGANYRAACRAKSPADFIAKLGIVEEEADECSYWLDLLIEAGLLSHQSAAPVQREAHELTAIIVSSIKTARQNRQK